MGKAFLVFFFSVVLTSDFFGVVIGRSVQGRRIQAFVYGRGEETILFVGGIHGDEPQSVAVLNRFRRLIANNPSLRRGARVVIVPLANPDGYRRRQRVNVRRIDINRNFPTACFTTNYRRRSQYPGRKPASEPETRALMELLRRYKPSLVVSIHTPLHVTLLKGDVEWLARRMQHYNHYPLVTNLGYETPGSFGNYAEERGIPMITIELPNLPNEAIWQQNRGALLAVLRHSPAREARRRRSLYAKENPTVVEALQRTDWPTLRERFTDISGWKGVDAEGNSALHWAIQKQHTTTALWLIEQGVHLNTTNRQGWSPLMEATYQGQEDVVRALLRRGVSPNQRTGRGWTPLIVAAQNGYGSVVQVLLEAGANVNTRDRFGYTPLMEAVRRQHGGIVAMLLAGGARAGLTDRHGRTAAQQAVFARSTNAVMLVTGRHGQ